MKRIFRLYVSFWIVLLIFVITIKCFLLNGHLVYDLDIILLNFMGWRWDFCLFTWFLLPYIVLTLCSKAIFLIIDKRGVSFSIVLGVFSNILASWFISRYFNTYLSTHLVVYHMILVVQTFLGLIIGASIAHLELKGSNILIPYLQGNNIQVIVLLLLAFFARSFMSISIINPYFSALVVWLVLHLKFHPIIGVPLIHIGKASMMMWFCHGYLGVVMFSELILKMRWPLLIWFVWGVVSFAIAKTLMPLSKRICHIMNLN